jgi:hypothetical protein
MLPTPIVTPPWAPVPDQEEDMLPAPIAIPLRARSFPTQFPACDDTVFDMPPFREN